LGDAARAREAEEAALEGGRKEAGGKGGRLI